jgi:hypothetical protein
MSQSAGIENFLSDYDESESIEYNLNVIKKSFIKNGFDLKNIYLEICKGDLGFYYVFSIKNVELFYIYTNVSDDLSEKFCDLKIKECFEKFHNNKNSANQISENKISQDKTTENQKRPIKRKYNGSNADSINQSTSQQNNFSIENKDEPFNKTFKTS